MANQGQGGRSSSGQGSSGSGGRGFAGMDDEQQREIARQGGEASARSQTRDEDGQFAGKQSKGSRSGGSGSSGGSSRSGGGSSGGSSRSGGGSSGGR